MTSDEDDKNMTEEEKDDEQCRLDAEHILREALYEAGYELQHLSSGEDATVVAKALMKKIAEEV